MKLLVTGGAGYIGSHAVRLLLDAGHHVTVLDDLSTGHRSAVDERAELVEAHLTDAIVVDALRGIDAVLHFAAFSLVGESMDRPLKYWRNNVGGSLALLEAMQTAGVSRLIFSSTAATYGHPATLPIVETTEQAPINPYGQSKLAMERMIADHAAAHPDFAYAVLRYFNVAGCSWGLGERHDPETHLVPIILQAASGQRDGVAIYGTDYDTPDGTCIRDYVHVEDLVEAHAVVLAALQPGDRRVYNVGSGRGWSVREVMEEAKRVTGVDFVVREGERRAGDPAILVTSPAKLEQELGWRTTRSSMQNILATHWAFVQS